MAYVPSINLSDVLEHAAFGVWIEHMHDGRDALVCKAPETVGKAVYRGAKCAFLPMVVPADHRAVLCLGLKVHDESHHPFTAAASTVAGRHVEAVKNILAARSMTMHLLNELNHPVLSAWCMLDNLAAQAALDRLAAAQPYVLEPPMPIPSAPEVVRLANAALDQFQQRAYPSISGGDAAFDIPLTLDVWPAIDVFEVTPTLGGGPFRIDEADEGRKLERAVEVAIDAIYPGGSFRTPTVGSGSARRELTDLLAFDAQWICVVESKALSVLGADRDRPSERRAATITKHVRKALDQLRGALVNVRSDVEIKDAGGSPIAIVNRETSPAQAIVLLSEMYAFLDWRAIAEQVMEASESDRYRALFHVMDLSELGHLVRMSANAEMFNQFLFQRWAQVKIKGTAYGRVRHAVR